MSVCVCACACTTEGADVMSKSALSFWRGYRKSERVSSEFLEGVQILSGDTKHE